MKYKITYKGSVEKDFRKFSKNKTEREKLKASIESVLIENPFQGKKLKAEYKGSYSIHIRYKVLVVYKIFAAKVLILVVEPREGSYKKKDA